MDYRVHIGDIYGCFVRPGALAKRVLVAWKGKVSCL